MSLSLYRFIVRQKETNTPKTLGLLKNAHVLGFKEIEHFECSDIYFLEGNLNLEDQKLLSKELLVDTFLQEGHWELSTVIPAMDGRDPVPGMVKNKIEVALRPGVTDVVAEQIVRSAHLLGIKGLHRAATGQQIIVQCKKQLDEKALQLLAEKLLSNTVIQHYQIGTMTHVFSSEINLDKNAVLTQIIPIRTLDKQQLELLSRERRAALDEAEMLGIQKYYVSENRDPTDVEFEMIAQTWSEHCSHKTFKASIEMNDETIHGLLNTYIRKATETINAPWVHSAFVDNAGIIDFDDEYHISFKVETHNHPSAIEPFGGANTGLGGVIRDILGVSAKPIAATDVFCFGLQDISLENIPQGSLHPRLIASGVVAGVEDYGNKTGIPTVNGAVYYDAAYTANPLVFCGCVGLAPKNSHPRQPQQGDRIIVLGGRTGRDGLRGATFSSLTMDAQTGEVAGASVQIGDPIIARGLIEVVTRARDAHLYHAITDCGAGGLSSAVGEMASNTGAIVELSHVKLKYQGLYPWEIWLSEAQERMVMAVPSQHISRLQAICDNFDVELTDIGEFTESSEIVVNYNHKTVLKLSNQFLHKGMPEKKLSAKGEYPLCKRGSREARGDFSSSEEKLLSLLSHPNTASKEKIIRRYDHEVQGGTVIKPLTGSLNDGPSDACVLKPAGTKGVKGIVLSNGLNPELGKKDPYQMAINVIDEAIRNAVAVGADPKRIAILDNFCWGDPKRPETLYALVEAARGCYDAALHYQTPFISGKDSLNNEYLSTDGKRHAIPHTLLISAMGIIHDIHTAVTMDFKSSGNHLYLLGDLKETANLPSYAPLLYQYIHINIQAKRIRACHDLSEGGLAVTLAEMCIGGRLGCKINAESINFINSLFIECNGSLVAEISPKDSVDFEASFPESLLSYVHKIGVVSENPAFIVTQENQKMMDIPLEQLVQAFFHRHEN